MRIFVDDERCVGAGSCVMSAPQVFDQNDSGLVVLLAENPSADLRQSVQEAVAICPAAALRLVED